MSIVCFPQTGFGALCQNSDSDPPFSILGPFGAAAIQISLQMFSVGLKQDKVGQPIITLLTVYVMHNLMRLQVTPKVFLHHKPMLLDVLLFPVVLSVGF